MQARTCVASWPAALCTSDSRFVHSAARGVSTTHARGCPQPAGSNCGTAAETVGGLDYNSLWSGSYAQARRATG